MSIKQNIKALFLKGSAVLMPVLLSVLLSVGALAAPSQEQIDEAKRLAQQGNVAAQFSLGVSIILGGVRRATLPFFSFLPNQVHFRAFLTASTFN